MHSKIYLAGKMTGLEDFGKPKFFEAEKFLKTHGFTVLHTASLPEGWDYEDYISVSLALVEKCNILCLLPDWQDSLGVTEYELPLAEKLKKMICEYEELKRYLDFACKKAKSKREELLLWN